MSRIDFDCDSEKLDEVIEILKNGLALRPTPAGLPYDNLEAAMTATDDYFEKLQEIGEGRSGFEGDDLLDLATGMVAAYHRLWESPFPSGLEAGQALFSAILERPLRDLLRGLMAVREGETAGHEPLLLLDSKEEVAYFIDWVRSQPAYPAGIGRLQPRRSTPVTGKQNFGYGSLAASFLLGWWFGNE
ncbi:MAG: hypothetical protein AB7F21_06815 [Desulfuromonadales bacterium]